MDRGEPVSREPYTVSQLFALPDDGKRYEIYDGEVHMVPPPGMSHQFLSSKLHVALARHIEAHDLGIVLAAPVALVLSETNYVEPDLVYVSRKREAILTERGVEGVPDLVVELLSPSTRERDLEIKLRIYERFGVAHYWVIDPRARTLIAYEIGDDGRYRESVCLGHDGRFAPTLFPGLSLELATLWWR